MVVLDQKSAYPLWLFFIIHAIVFAIANFFLLIINLIGSPFQLWFFAPLIVWGLVLDLHYQINKLIIKGFFSDLKNKVLEKLNQ